MNKTIFAQEAQDLTKKLHIDYAQGLLAPQAIKQLRRYGINRVRLHLWHRFFVEIVEELKAASSLLLLSVMLLEFLQGDYTDASIVGVVLFITVIIGAIQTVYFSYHVDNLPLHMQEYYRVLRNGIETDVHAHHLVPGEVLLLREGQTVPVDGHILEASKGLKIHPSASSQKQYGIEDILHTVELKAGDPVFTGSIVQHGNLKMLVVATGNHTVYAHAFHADISTNTQMRSLLDSFFFTLGIALAIVCFALVVLTVLGGAHILHMLTIFIVLFSEALPETLPLALFVILYNAAARLKQRGLIVVRLSSLEQLQLSNMIVVLDEQFLLRAQEGVKAARAQGVAILYGTHRSAEWLREKLVDFGESHAVVIDAEQLDDLKIEDPQERLNALKHIKGIAALDDQRTQQFIDLVQSCYPNALVIQDGEGLMAARANFTAACIGAPDVVIHHAQLIVQEANLALLVEARRLVQSCNALARRVVRFACASSLTEVIIVAVAVLCRMPLPYTAAHLLCMLLSVDLFNVIGLANEEPRERGRRINSTADLVPYSAVIKDVGFLSLASLLLWWYLLNFTQNSLLYNQTLLTFFGILMHNVSVLTERGASIHQWFNWRSNRFLMIIFWATLLLLPLFFHYLTPHIFGWEPLIWDDMGLCLLLSLSVPVVKLLPGEG